MKPAAAAVVVNGRASGVRDPERLLSEVVSAARDGGWRVDGQVTHSEAELAEALDGGGRRVVLVGGDGALHTALNAVGQLPELALVPSGRANNVARALGIPLDLRRAVEVALGAPARPIDVLRVENGSGPVYCVEGLSAGLQADARSRYSAPNSADLGAGARALAGALRDYRPYPVALWLNGRSSFVGEAAQVFLSNLPFFGFGFRVDPLARPSDGLLEAIVIEAGSRMRALRLLAATYRGTHLERAGVTLRRAREAVLSLPLPLAADGDVLGSGTVAVSVVQDRLRLAA